MQKKIRFHSGSDPTIRDVRQNSIRACIPMYLLSKYIRENTAIKVVFGDDDSSEIIFGYGTLDDALN